MRLRGLSKRAGAWSNGHWDGGIVDQGEVVSWVSCGLLGRGIVCTGAGNRLKNGIYIVRKSA